MFKLFHNLCLLKLRSFIKISEYKWTTDNRGQGKRSWWRTNRNDSTTRHSEIFSYDRWFIFNAKGTFQMHNFVYPLIRWLVNWLFNVTINDISVIYVTPHRCAGGLKKKLDLRSGSQRHRHFVGFFNVPVLAPTREHPFYTVIPTHRPI